MNHKFEKLGFYPADILLPKDQDMTKWAVVACDQFTSEPEYWQAVEQQVGDAPSTLRLILPEANLKAPNVDEYIQNINDSMSKYIADGVFETLADSLIYIERQQSDGKIRHGLIGMVDLDAYDFTPGSGALIRATEGTVLDRIPPRARVRRNAPIELPHVMLLIDDPDKTVIEPLTAAADTMETLYDFDLMQNGGHIKGYKLSQKQIDAVADALEGLTTDAAMQKKYNLTTIYITHDLGVVANVADRIAVMYAGDIVELGTCDEVFYDPRHPYTWALLSSLPQLGTKDEPLYSIQGTPPNLFHEVKGDAFAPRNPKALKIDFIERPPFFEVTPTHYARTWLLDPRAPKVEPPEHVRILREKGVNRVG